MSIERSEAIAITYHEGGNWIPWSEHIKNYTDAIKESNHAKYKIHSCVHSIRFVDGAVWDVFNGWRPNKHST